MVSRRTFLRTGALVVGASTSGCTGLLDGPTELPDAGLWTPSRVEFTEYGSVFEEDGYATWQVNAEPIRSHRDHMSEIAYGEFTNRFRRPGVPGVSPDAITTQVLGGTRALNSLPLWRLGRLGQIAYVVTLGDFDRVSVTTALAEAGLERDENADFTRFVTDEGIAWIVDDGWIVGGFASLVSTVVAAKRDGDGRLAESNDAFRTVIIELESTAFHYASSHEPRSETVLDVGRFEGQVAEGTGYEFTEDGPRLRSVRVFSEESLIERETIEEWAAETFENVAETEVSIEGRTAVIRGQADTFELAFTNEAFVPFR